MINVHINAVCHKRGITTAYQLGKRCGFTPSLASSLFNENFKLLSLETLDKLCNGLGCQPSDLLKSDTIVLTGLEVWKRSR